MNKVLQMVRRIRSGVGYPARLDRPLLVYRPAMSVSRCTSLVPGAQSASPMNEQRASPSGRARARGTRHTGAKQRSLSAFLPPSPADMNLRGLLAHRPPVNTPAKRR